MHIFLDESGDLGFDFNGKAPSAYFVITLLVCDNQDTNIVIKKAVEKTLKKKLHQKRKYQNCHELKGTEIPLSIKKFFYRHAQSSNGWKIYSIVLNKKAITKKLQRPINKHRVYNVLANYLLKQVDFTKVTTVNLLIDKSKNRDGIKEFDSMLKISMDTILPLNVPLNIDHIASHESYGIQAVDLFCWGIFRKYMRHDEEWYNVFKHKIIHEENFSIKKDGPHENVIPVG